MQRGGSLRYPGRGRGDMVNGWQHRGRAWYGGQLRYAALGRMRCRRRAWCDGQLRCRERGYGGVLVDGDGGGANVCAGVTAGAVLWELVLGLRRVLRLTAGALVLLLLPVWVVALAHSRKGLAMAIGFAGVAAEVGAGADACGLHSCGDGVGGVVVWYAYTIAGGALAVL